MLTVMTAEAGLCRSTMEGGAESGFRHVKANDYKPRLLHFSGIKKYIVVHEVRKGNMMHVGQSTDCGWEVVIQLCSQHFVLSET